MQDDALLATATPREALIFSASMRLPSSTTSKEIETLVDKLIRELGLVDCCNVMIGGPLIKGISGGQKKRTSIGIELITQPSLLFLDEPTSGLDSYAAYNCIKLLLAVAKSNCAILCTIHQPSSEVFHLFDLVIFMKDGRILYQGLVGNLIHHLASYGYACPMNYNPADFAMFISQTETTETLMTRGLFMPIKSFDKLNHSDSIQSNDRASVKLQNEDIPHILPVSKASFFRQLWYLIYREGLNVMRDVNALIGRFGITIFLNLLFGLIFFNAGGRDDSKQENFNTHFGALTMITVSTMFGCSQGVMLSFPFERPMFLREYATGTYSATAYFLGKVLWELPLTFLQTLVAFILVYFLCDFQGPFITLVAISCLLGISACSLAVLIGCMAADVKTVTELSPLLFVPQMLFAGFFVRTSQIPVFLRWAQYLCVLKYSMNLLILTEFDLDNKSCQGDAAGACSDVAVYNDVHKNDWWIYVLILLALFAGFRIFGVLMLIEKAKRFY